jgi:tetratricopeptide (TPR) repeat protein
MGAEAAAIMPATAGRPVSGTELRRHSALHTGSRLTKAERLRQRGRVREAIAECRKALDRAPDDPPTLLVLAQLVSGTDRDEACALATRAATLVGDDDPDRLAACARIIGESEPELTLDLYRRAVERAPQKLGWWLPIAKFAFVLNRLDLAIEAAERVLARHPDQPEAGVLLASALLRRRDFSRMAATLKSLERTGAQAANVANLAGTMLVQQGRIEEALATMRRVRELAPGSASLQMSRVMSLNYDPDLSRAELLAEHRAFGEAFAASVPPVARDADRDRDPERRLRIGYMSPDLRSHSVAYFALPLFEAFDRERFDVIAYAHIPKPDEVTARFRELASDWRDVAGMDDRRLAGTIRQDRVDILVDLAGLTRNSRLLACTARPAPIQMTYLGYPNTTGLGAVDYRVTDHVAEADDADDFYTETLIRLPRCFLAFAAPGHAPEITPPPVLQNGYVTFGSFNNLAKVNRQVVGLWSRVLQAVPGSCLLLKSSGTGDGTAQAHLRDAFRAAGIDPARVDFAAFAPTAAEHLEHYAEVDLALDTFPYNGTTTSCEALWMGVPVITLLGERHASRVGASLLRAVGFAAGIAGHADDYVATARLLAEQPQLLVALRGNLRADMARSVLCDGRSLTGALEDAYRAVWRIWCGQV